MKLFQESVVFEVSPLQNTAAIRGRQLMGLPRVQLCESTGVRLCPGTSNVSHKCLSHLPAPSKSVEPKEKATTYNDIEKDGTLNLFTVH